MLNRLSKYLDQQFNTILDQLNLAKDNHSMRKTVNDIFVDMVFHANPYGVMAGYFGTILIYSILLFFEHDWKIHTWFVLTSIMYGARYVGYRLHKYGCFLFIKKSEFRFSNFLITFIGGYVGLSCSALLLIVFTDQYLIISRYIVIFGLMLFFSGSIMLNANVIMWSLAFAAFSILPMTILFIQEGGIFVLMGIIFVYYSLFMLFMGIKTYCLNFESYVLRYQNSRYLQELHTSKLRLEDAIDDLKLNNENLNKEIHLRKQAEAQLRKMASTDVLTGVTNRVALEVEMQNAIYSAQRTQSMMGVLFIDLDRFKFINDTFGHDVGDELLKGVANRLSDCIRSTDAISRIGGDEFVIFMTNVLKMESFLTMAQNILSAFSAPFHIKGKEIVSNVSIGISIYPQNGTLPNDLIKNADTAMYQAKKVSGNSFFFFTPEMNDFMERRYLVENMLTEGIQMNGFKFVIQPVISVKTGEIVSGEFLIRMSDELKEKWGNIGPDEFIPIAEDCGLINKIGLIGLKEVCKTLKNWEKKGLGHLYAAFNVSIKHLVDPGFIDELHQEFSKVGANPGRLILEVTETQAIENKSFVKSILESIADMGIIISIDDFGIGHSNFCYLRELPVKKIKIDRSFLSDWQDNNDSRVLVEAMISVSKALHLEIVAEGVEFYDQLIMLQNHKCDYAQGFLFSKAVPENEFIKLVKRGSFYDFLAEPHYDA